MIADENKMDSTIRRSDDSFDGDNEKYLQKIERKRRRMERKELTKDVPQVDSNGISYTKKQIRLMKKRVSRGLPPIESQEERNERLEREIILKNEEEKELAGLMNETCSKVGKAGSIEDYHELEVDDENSSCSNKELSQQLTSVKEFDSKKYSSDKEYHIGSLSVSTNLSISKNKKTMRQKPLPDDYVCSACQNIHQPKHWIYDCPYKKTIRSGNGQLSAGIKNPDERKVFVSGLPFDFKLNDIVELFNQNIKGSKVLNCKIIKYGDSGRCKGQAYVTLDTEDGAQQAVAMSGMKIDKSTVADKDSIVRLETKHQQSAESQSTSSQLELKVTKCLNRFELKMRKTKSTHQVRKRRKYEADNKTIE